MNSVPYRELEGKELNQCSAPGNCWVQGQATHRGDTVAVKPLLHLLWRQIATWSNKRAELHPHGQLTTFLHGKTQTAPLGIINLLKPACLIKLPQKQTKPTLTIALSPSYKVLPHLVKIGLLQQGDFKAQPAATHSPLIPAVSPPPSKLLWLLFPHWI